MRPWRRWCGPPPLTRTWSNRCPHWSSTPAPCPRRGRHPSLLCCQLPSWTEFLTAFGLNKAHVQHVLCQTPEALLQGDLVKAGESILAFRRLGMDERAASQLVTYYPQLLGKSDEDIRATVNLLGRFQQGVESSSC